MIEDSQQLMTKPINIIDGLYFLGTTPLPDNPGLRELALHWYRLGHADGKQEQQDRLGHGPNKRVGFFHNHSGMTECGQAYRHHERDLWYPCRKYVNHDGDCGYEDNTAF